MTPHRADSAQPNSEWLSNTAPSDPSEEFDALLDEIEDEDLTEVLSEFLVSVAE